MNAARPIVPLPSHRKTVPTTMPGMPQPDSVRTMMPTMGMLLRQARRKRGLTMTTVARRCGLSPSVLCRMELARREPRITRLLAVCDVLGVRFSDIMRAAEDEAYPLDGHPWTNSPDELLTGESQAGEAVA